MAAVTVPDAAGAADWLSITPAIWPPPVPGPPVLLQAIVQLSQQCTSGFLPQIMPGQLFWCEPRIAPILVASSQAVIAPAGSVLRPEPPLTVSGIPGIGAGTQNSSR